MMRWRRWASFIPFALVLLFFSPIAPASGGEIGTEGSVPPPVVPVFAWDSHSDFRWASVSPSDSYNIYRGDVSILPASDFGNCYAGGLPVTNGSDPANPTTAGEIWIYLVTANLGYQEGTLGDEWWGPLAPPGPERANIHPCFAGPFPVLLDLLNPDPPDPLDGVQRGVEAPRNPAVANDLNKLAGGSVYLHTGEFFLEVVDLEIPGRGLNWQMARSYRSQINHDGQVGRNWTFNYDRRVVVVAGGLLYLDGMGRQDEYVPISPTLYEPAEPGIYSKILEDATGFTLRERDGTLYHHHPFIGGGPLDGRLDWIEDRAGNRMSFIYDGWGNLDSVVDTLGRTIDYYWNTDGRLSSVVDYHGRQVRYQYDADGNLISVTRPPVTGTSTGNDFPAGKTTTYVYSGGFANAMLNHNLVEVWAPGDPEPVIINSYNAEDELVWQRHGGLNSSGVFAGGDYQYAINKIGSGDRIIQVLDRNGVTHEFYTDPAGHAEEENIYTFPLRPTDPPVYTTNHSYNLAGERVQTVNPTGNRIEYGYDDLNSDLFQRGNLLTVERLPDGRGDGFGGGLASVQAHYQYEPLYTQQALIRDPMLRESIYTYDYQEGDPAINGVGDLITTWSINAAGFPLAMGDVNHDGQDLQNNGSPVALRQPDVTLLPGGRQEAIAGAPFQEVWTYYWYNDLGQIIAEIDPEKNVKEFRYYPEEDPDGDGLPSPPPLDGRILDPADGGYLQENVLDADPTPYVSAADLAGRDNGTNPPVNTIVSNYSYDPVGNRISETDANGHTIAYEVNQLGQLVSVTRGIGGPSAYTAEQIYNERDEIVARRVQADPPIYAGPGGGWIDTEIVLDILGNAVEVRREIDSALWATTFYQYDPQENRTAITFPEGNQFTMAVDERELLYRLVRGDDDGDALNGGPLGSSMQVYNYDLNGNPLEFVDGRGYAWPYKYDGLDRRVRTKIYHIDSFFDVYYNPDESVQRQLVRNAALTVYHETAFEYDELGRLVTMNQLILDDTGTVIPEDANGDGIAETHYEYDRNSRRSRVMDDSGRIEDYDQDGAGRMVHKVDAWANSIDYEYDPLNRLISTLETENTPFGPELYSTQNNYDWLGRLQDTTDNLGNTRTFEYDSRDNLVRVTDALGNVTTYSYDGLDRRIETDRHMTVDGTGGTAVVDHLIYGYRYDTNGRVTGLVDPENNATRYEYDSLNRLIQQTLADGSTMEYTYDENDNVVTVKDANGSVIEIDYDDADRPIFRNGLSVASGVHNVAQWFDYDNMNRLVQAAEAPPIGPNIVVNFSYDSLNRIREERTQVAGNPVRTFTYTYDGVGNRLTANFPTLGPANALSYSYDILSRLDTVQDTQTGFYAGHEYLGPERLAQRFNGNGTRKSFLDPLGTAVIGYDPLKRIQHLEHYDPTNASQTTFGYGYDPEGNIRYEQRHHDGGAGDVWTYDSAYRVNRFVKRVQDPVAEAATPGSGGAYERYTDYTLDRVGNWVERTIGDMFTPPQTYGNQINNLNEYGEKPDDGITDDFDDDLGTAPLDGINLAHDLNGNLIREESWRYEYDIFNRLHKVVDAGVDVLWYSYDGLNRRTIEKQVRLSPTHGTRFVHDGDHLVTELRLNDLDVEVGMEQRYFYGREDQPVATYDDSAGTLYYLHEDARGNVTAITDTTGAVVERITYDDNGDPEFLDPASNPTGLMESAKGNRVLYLAKVWDPQTRFHQKRGGYFAPRFGRHIQRLMPGQTVGPFGLALNPPMLFPNFLDPLGMHPFWWCRGWFWDPIAWWGGWWAWKPVWWWGGPWGWWHWRPWLWLGAPHGWWILKPWGFWWGGPVDWWGWPAWGARPGWWGWWPWWGWGGWRSWLPVWGWMGWKAWWPIWGWNGWVGWWPAFGWWGWGGWWPSWTLWWGWHPHWWNGWWTWMPWFHWGWWSWSGIGFWWNWWAWVHWWPWSWWNWVGWWPWWGWAGWNPWWYWGWWSWYLMDWTRGIGWWWGPIGWWYWFGWWWVPWWWCFWGGAGWWVWWFWPWWVNWWWWGWWSWHWRLWSWPWWGWWRWWGWWWPWWGWWH